MTTQVAEFKDRDASGEERASVDSPIGERTPNGSISEHGPGAADASPARTARPFLQRGEAIIAVEGLAITAIFVLAVLATGIWAQRSQRQSEALARYEATELVMASLTQAAEALLASGDVSALRRFAADTARSAHLSKCEITLPGGAVLVSLDSSHITAKRIPEVWPDGILEAPRPAETTADAPAFTRLLKVPGRGNAQLFVAASRNTLYATLPNSSTGLGVIGAAALGSGLFVYRGLRSRLRGIGAVREALLAGGSGETGLPALMVSADFGPEAAAWNRMLLDRERLDAKVLVCQAREMLNDRRGDRGDLEGVFDAMSQGLLLLDENLRLKFVNGAAAVFLQARRDDLVGAEAAKFIGDDKVMAAIAEVATGASRRRTTLEIRRGAGVLKFSVRPVRREDSAAAMVVIEDVTQQRVADEARNSFVAQATHELRTPLTNIRLYVEQAIDEGESDPQLRAKCLNVINQEARRLENIVGEMLSVSEIEAGSMKLRRDDVRLDALFDELRADFAGQAAEKTLDLKFVLPPKLPAIQADGDKVKLAVHNLVGNALKYTPAGGQVKVTVDVTRTEFRVEVADTGIGISPEDQPRVFDKFFRARDPRVGKITGTGLGLTLAREVIRLHGGEVTLESQLNKGSTFTLTCPITLEGL